MQRWTFQTSTTDELLTDGFSKIRQSFTYHPTNVTQKMEPTDELVRLQVMLNIDYEKFPEKATKITYP